MTAHTTAYNSYRSFARTTAYNNYRTLAHTTAYNSYRTLARNNRRQNTNYNTFIHSILLLALYVIPSNGFELDTSDRGQVECIQCVQLWKSATRDGSKGCSQPSTCKGDACFMRQCKHCPVYQYMAGCVSLTPWQLADLEVNRRGTERRTARVGAELLCEDTFNQTTCVCNRRDRCNSIHTRVPFNIFGDGLFRGVVNFDQVIADLDPRYLEVIRGYQRSFYPSDASSRDRCNSIHTRVPFNIFGDGLFRGVVNFDQVIADLDPRYLEVIRGYQRSFYPSDASRFKPHCLLILLLLVTVMKIL